MIDEQTEVVFMDEWTSSSLSCEDLKRVLQGIRFIALNTISSHIPKWFRYQMQMFYQFILEIRSIVLGFKIAMMVQYKICRVVFQ